jgi:shikimate kinase
MEFIRNHVDVEEPDKVRIIRQDGHAGESGLPSGGLLLLIGLPGSGKSAVGQGLATKLGLSLVRLPVQGAASALAELVRGGAAVVEVPHTLLADPELRAAIQASGRVIYLMTNIGAIVRRLAKEPGESEATLALRDGMARLLGTYEPLFMQTLHLLVPADGPLEEVEALALERVRL